MYVFVTMSEAAPVTVTSCLIFNNFAIFIIAFEVCLDGLILTTPCLDSHLRQCCKINARGKGELQISL